MDREQEKIISDIFQIYLDHLGIGLPGKNGGATQPDMIDNGLPISFNRFLAKYYPDIEEGSIEEIFSDDASGQPNISGASHDSYGQPGFKGMPRFIDFGYNDLSNNIQEIFKKKTGNKRPSKEQLYKTAYSHLNKAVKSLNETAKIMGNGKVRYIKRKEKDENCIRIGWTYSIADYLNNMPKKVVASKDWYSKFKDFCDVQAIKYFTDLVNINDKIQKRVVASKKGSKRATLGPSSDRLLTIMRPSDYHHPIKSDSGGNTHENKPGTSLVYSTEKSTGEKFRDTITFQHQIPQYIRVNK